MFMEEESELRPNTMTTFFSIVLLLLLAVLFIPRHGNCQNVSNSTNKSIINIAVLLDFRSGKEGRERAILLAKTIIENSTEFKHLTDSYKLELIIKYDYNYPSKTIDRTYQFAHNYKPFPLVLIGPIDSKKKKTVDYAAQTFDSLKVVIVTLSVAYDQDDSLSQPVLSALSGVDQEVEARVAFIKRLNWKRVAVIYSLQKNYHSFYLDKMLDSFNDKSYPIQLIGYVGIELREQILKSGVEVLQSKLQVLKQNDTKIFLADLDPYEALLLFCEVYNLNMYGEDIVWIISSNAKKIDDWIRFNDTHRGQIVKCSPENIREAADGSFMFDRQIIREDSRFTASGLTADEFLTKLVEMGKASNLTSDKLDRNDLKYSASVFDALWAVATALNNSIDPVRKKLNRSLYFENPYPDLDVLEKILFEKMKQVDFQGIAGTYSYSKPSTKDGTVRVLHYEDRATRLVNVGHYDSKQNNLTFLNDTRFLWGSAGVPKDRSTVVKKILTVSRTLFIAIATLAAIGILLGILFLTFNLVYRKYKFIKLSAPLFNNIIAGGCILCLVSVFLFGIHDTDNNDTQFPLICKARAWTLTLGFSFAFGAMFIKTWRIYKICTNKKLRMKLGPLSNWYLLSLMGGIAFVDLIILITWELVDPLNYKQIVIKKKEQDPNVRFQYINKVINVCHAEHMVIWLTIIYVYKGILILYGLFLAYETRNVIYAHLNDSRVIGICVYNVVVLSVVGAFLSLLLEDKSYQEMFIVLSVCIIFPSMATICLMMFPKIAYRCKTNNLDDTETIANGMSTVRDLGTFTGTSMNGPQIHVTTHVSANNTPEPSSSRDAKFSYQKEVDPASSDHSTNAENL